VFALTPTPPAPPLVKADVPSMRGIADRYEIVPCTVNPAHVRLIVYAGGKIDYTRRLAALGDAQNFAREYVTNDAFRKSVKAEARAHMESY
jgi:hypothetical protein